MNETSALLSCPCCPKGVAKECGSFDNAGYFYVCCPTCGIRTGEYEASEYEQMYADWNRRPSSPAPVKTNHELHREIMNLPCEKDGGITFLSNPYIAYKEGHKQARHAAAELALQYSPAPVNTQGLREALLAVNRSGFYGISTGYYHISRVAWAKVGEALAQAGQEQPTPSIAHSLQDQDVAEAIQNLAGGVRTGLTIRIVLGKVAGNGAPTEKKIEVTAWADTPKEPTTAGAYSLDGILGAMSLRLSQPQ